MTEKTRICQRCGVEKPIGEFFQIRAPSPAFPGGRSKYCDACVRPWKEDEKKENHDSQ